MACEQRVPSAPAGAQDWHRFLEGVQQLGAGVLGLEELFLFELDQSADQSPLLMLRAPQREGLQGQHIPADRDLVAWLEEAGGPAVLDAACPATGLEGLAPFLAARGVALALVSPVRQGERLWGCLVGCCAHGRSFAPAEVSAFSLLAAWVATTVENVRLRTENAFRLSEAMSLRAASSALVEHQSLDAILGAIIDEAIRALNAWDALVLLLEDHKKERFRVIARTGPDLTRLGHGWLSVEGSLNGLVVKTGSPLVSRDAQKDPRANRARARRLRVRSVAIAPLKIRGQVIGTLAVHNKRDGFFSQTDVDILCALANQAAVAIDNMRLFEEAMRARDEVQRMASELREAFAYTMNVQEEERQRIAADLHDRVVSRLVAAMYEVESCISLARRGGEGLEERLGSVWRLLDEGVKETRDSIYNLWPATLEHMGLEAALRELVRRFGEGAGLRCSLQVHGASPPLDLQRKVALYRIVQEALANVRQHAGPCSVEISLHFDPHLVRVLVQDDGVGFDVERVLRTAPAQHFGLLSIRERALGLGGTVRVQSAVGEGTRILVEVPCCGLHA
ncbi:MAG: GAF domain-containing protein [Anaerolineae bacterium]